ncbi:MAG: hypothetical protein WD042_09825 [Phycisphaeraceae bacterium]
MPRGQFLTPHQQKIVKRYYAHLDTITLGKLGEAVSDLYVCEDAKKADRLWAGVERCLAKTGANESLMQRIVTQRDVPALAKLLTDITSGRAELKPR